MRPVKISEEVYYLNVSHRDRRLFDALIPLPDGTSYNSYIVKGKNKTVLFDAADPEKMDILMDFLKEIPEIDYVVAHHAEQDHSGGIPQVLEKYPEAKVLTNPKCKEMLIDHLHIPEDRVITVKDRETLDIGGKTLEFVYAPWVHWPETMCTYLKEDRILFTCDFFGSHLATSEIYSSEKTIYEPMKRYYAEIMMPFRSSIKNNLEKIENLEISLIAPSHGPIHKNVGFVKELYKDWTANEPKSKVLIAWVSMHGSTGILVKKLISCLQEKGICVDEVNLEDFDIGKAAISLVDCATIVIGCPTVLTGPHPKAVYVAYLANILRPKAKFLSVIGSYGWGGKTLEILSSLISNLKVEVLKPVIVKGLPRPTDIKQIEELAELIAEKHKNLFNIETKEFLKCS